jgi:uncharacterized protein (TIRG00374 family)
VSISSPEHTPAPSRKAIVKRGIAITLGGLVLYLVFPRVTQVLASWPRLSTLNPVWFLAAVAAEAASFGCTFALKRLALRTRAWFPVVTAALSGNAITNILPGGAAAGAAVELRLLSVAGVDTDTAVGGLTAFSLLEVGSLLALPVFSLPAILFGAPVSRGLVQAAYVGIAGFVVFTLFGVVVMATDRPLTLLGRAVERMWNRIAPRRRQVHELDRRLLGQRDSIRSVLGKQWWQAILLCAGRLALDFLALLATLSATGASPRPSLVLLAYSAASVIALVPLTPGGLGIVEASLSGLLVLAGVRSGDAFLATLAYRLTSYWLPLVVGPVAFLMFRRRYGSVASPTSAGRVARSVQNPGSRQPAPIEQDGSRRRRPEKPANAGG